MINEGEKNFVECYKLTSAALCDNEALRDLDGLGGVIKAVVEVAEDYNFDIDDLKHLFDRYVSEIYG